MYVYIEVTCYCAKGYFMAATRRHEDDHDNNNHFALLLHVYVYIKRVIYRYMNTQNPTYIYVVVLHHDESLIL